MGVSAIEIQRSAILNAIRNATRGNWMVMVVDQNSWRLITNVLKEDDVLSEKIANIEHIEQRRQPNRDMDAIYFLSPEAHIVDCIMADFEHKRYRGVILLWTGHRSRIAQEQIKNLQVVDVGYFPRESNLVVFRDPYSFPVLYHPGFNHHVRQHLSELAQKVVSVCVSLEEYPTIRYYRPRASAHEASVLCSHLARFIQEEIDMYATYHRNFPPPSNRPRGVLYVCDRSMDLVAPVIHEFTYQAMCHDLLPIKEGDKVTYKMRSSSDQPERDVEISEKDKIWIMNRHRHMKDTIEKLMGEFQRFIDDNPHFTNQNPDTTTSISAIKDMMAGLPEFQETKEAYSLHLTMAQESMNLFQARKLPDLASIEQILATGLDEDHKKPKAVADQVIRSLDEEGVTPPDRLRLIILYLLFRDGILPIDAQRLLAHANLPPSDGEALRSLALLGARVSRPLKEKSPKPQPLFPPKPPSTNPDEEYSLSRFEPALKLLLEEHCKNTLDQQSFPYTKPQLEATDGAENTPSASLRSAKPTWAKAARSNEPRQRIIVFMAGGATYSESRACYEVSEARNKDVYLITTHMLTPSLFVRQLGDLGLDKRNIKIPQEQPKPKAPAHLFEPEPPLQAPRPAPTPQIQPPSSQMGSMSLNSSNGPSRPNGQLHPPPKPPQNHALAAATAATGPRPPGGGEEKEKKKKKKHFPFI
ncbi:MAG: hypothetical protein Q9162_001128 [Coniocarpon cinnabarinum]